MGVNTELCTITFSQPSKIYYLKILLDSMNANDKKTDCILLCERFLTAHNEDMFKINGYNFACRNISKPSSYRGDVALYIKQICTFRKERI